METFEERLVPFYLVRYFNEVTKKWATTRWRMSAEAAASRYAGQQYEILRGTRIYQRLGGDPMRSQAGHLYQKRE
ncbi:MAG: hypothetical protein V4582_16490 [Pseudomonadota bacterium]